MYDGILKKLDADICGERMLETVKAIHARDRWTRFSLYRETARMCLDRMKQIGLKSPRIYSAPADGKTSFADFVMPRAWDPEEAELQVKTPDGDWRTLANYLDNPCNLAIYSAPTPAAGIETELVSIRGDQEADYKGRNLKGKIIFTHLYMDKVWRLAARHGVAGIVSDTSEPREKHDGVRWLNYTFFPNNKAGQFGFSLSREAGDYLRGLAKRAARRGQSVKVRARVKARLYNGTIETVTGVVPGKNPNEEVLAFSHLNEFGAWDNASGSAAVLEIARVLTNLIADGKLPQPQRSIRFMLGWECYSLAIYLLREKRKTMDSVAGLSLDAFGVDPLRFDAPFRAYATPDANPAYTDLVLKQITDQYLANKHHLRLWRTGRFFGGDGLPSVPCFNTPMIYFYQNCPAIHHSSADTPDKLTPESLKWAGVICGAYLYSIANAGYDEALSLANQIALSHPQLLADLAANPDREPVEYLREREIARLHSTRRLVPKSRRAKFDKQLAPLAERIERAAEGTILDKQPAQAKKLTKIERKAASMVPTRIVPGILTLETLPEKVNLNCRWGPRYSVLKEPSFWCNGERHLLQIHRNVTIETGKETDLADLVAAFEFLEKYGYMSIERIKSVR